MATKLSTLALLFVLAGCCRDESAGPAPAEARAAAEAFARAFDVRDFERASALLAESIPPEDLRRIDGWIRVNEVVAMRDGGAKAKITHHTDRARADALPVVRTPDGWRVRLPRHWMENALVAVR